MNLDTVPILIDDQKNTGSIKLTRCNYFSIECDDPSSGWTLTLEGQRIPFFLIGLSGIITHPMGELEFRNPESIETLFSTIEENQSLFVDMNQIWLPNQIFPREPRRGTVYRVQLDLFSAALRFQNQQLQYSEFLESAFRLRDRIVFSETESSAFAQWERQIIEEAKQSYPKSRELELLWQNSSTEDRQ